ncbi:ribose-5-phosphate isomerase RpiA [Arsenophonus symbiont of Ornithomya chloropus]|uniref:ribose-5-phosphate isomerase RpiA n=1 Tax=Arsenophonus symbiont of Ornithomya chloropus TaxID=634121 RepID=UPI0032B28D69
MKQNVLKKIVGCAVLEYIKPYMVVGVGTGSTVSYFIDSLVTLKDSIKGAVSSSIASSDKLRYLSIPILDSNHVDSIDVYVDGTDEFNSDLMMIKGGGGALTQEKVLAAMSKKFIVIADQSKKVDILGKFPLPIEVIPMAKAYVTRELMKLGGLPEYRKNILTDNGNIILDIHNLNIMDPVAFENKINSIVGVVTVGLFANRAADMILMATLNGVVKKFISKNYI